jgi:hypothetical protein
MIQPLLAPGFEEDGSPKLGREVSAPVMSVDESLEFLWTEDPTLTGRLGE